MSQRPNQRPISIARGGTPTRPIKPIKPVAKGNNSKGNSLDAFDIEITVQDEWEDCQKDPQNGKRLSKTPFKFKPTAAAGSQVPKPAAGRVLSRKRSYHTNNEYKPGAEIQRNMQPTKSQARLVQPPSRQSRRISNRRPASSKRARRFSSTVLDSVLTHFREVNAFWSGVIGGAPSIHAPRLFKKKSTKDVRASQPAVAPRASEQVPLPPHTRPASTRIKKTVSFRLQNKPTVCAPPPKAKEVDKGLAMFRAKYQGQGDENPMRLSDPALHASPNAPRKKFTSLADARAALMSSESALATGEHVKFVSPPARPRTDSITRRPSLASPAITPPPSARAATSTTAPAKPSKPSPQPPVSPVRRTSLAPPTASPERPHGNKPISGLISMYERNIRAAA